MKRLGLRLSDLHLVFTTAIILLNSFRGKRAEPMFRVLDRLK